MPRVHSEDFDHVKHLYDNVLDHNELEQKIIYPRAYGVSEYIGQYSDNTVSDLRRMGHAMSLPGGSRVLDGGCGPGVVACLFAEEFGWAVTGVDISRRHLDRAQDRAAKSHAAHHIIFRNQNLYEVPEDEGFDAAYGTGAWCHFDASELFAKLKGVVRTGGRVAFMERVRNGTIPHDLYDAATLPWACPAIYSVDEYISVMETATFRNVLAEDMSRHFRALQASQIQARLDCKQELIRSTSQTQFDKSLALARAEFDLTAKGLLGYALIVAERI
jgi:cyclopropane fatty-acyl-phospholipid synthase-like methyltransferase